MKKIVIIGLMIITFISCSNNVFAENVDLNFKTKVHLEEKLLGNIITYLSKYTKLNIIL